jgi:hypothetical protein
VEAVLRTNDGSKFRISGPVPAPPSTTNNICWVWESISASGKAVENALKESEALYRIFAERMTEGVIFSMISKYVRQQGVYRHDRHMVIHPC